MSDASNAWFQRQADVKFAAYSETTGARNEQVAAVTGKKIRVLSWTLNASAAENTATWESATTALSGAIEIANNAVVGASYAGGLFETVAGEALNVTQGAASLMSGHITYVLV